MRRNRNSMGRGGGRGGPNMPGGPLLTAHLKDIDLELELLKRKREMLEQQQHQFSMQPFQQQPHSFKQLHQPFNQQHPPRNFIQPPYFRGQNEHDDSNFSHLYNDGPQLFNRKPFGKKRNADASWQHESFTKRPSGPGPRGGGPSFAGPPAPSVRAQRPFSGPSYHPKGFKINQGKASVGQKIGHNKQNPPKNVNVSKVTKPTKAATPPNSLASQPVAERSNLVAAAIKSVAAVETREREAMRLVADVTPSPQINGRLELALGAILRDVRERCAESPHAEVLRGAGMQRVLKQSIRERIRAVMLGKIIGSTVDIINEYRVVHPKEKDYEVVNIALEVVSLPPETPTPVTGIVTEKEKPDEYYKENMSALISIHLQEMFDKLHDIYSPPEENQAEKQAEGDFTKDVAPGQETNKTDNGETNGQESEKAEAAMSIEKDKNTQPRVLDKSVNNAAVTKQLDEIIASLGDKANPNDYKRMMPTLLKKYIPTILKMLHVNKMYRSVVADLQAVTREKYVNYGITKNAAKPVDNVATSETSASNTPAQGNKSHYPTLPYYVKLMGKPQLPKKKIMQAFLEIFHPKSIKKHRSIHNLLFIGFSDKSDFDGIIQADGTMFGRTIISVRACEKSAAKPEDNVSNAADVSTGSVEGSDIIGSELDGQITDLLTSIKNSESDKDTDKIEGENNTNGEEKIVKAENGEKAADEDIEDNNENAEQAEKVEANSETPKKNVESTPEEKSKPETEANKSVEATKDTKADNPEPAKTEVHDQVAELKSAASGRSTPTRSSSRLASTPATPSSIRTRRASRLMQ